MPARVLGLPEALDRAVTAALADAALPAVVAGVGPQATGRVLDLSQDEWLGAVHGAKAAFRAAQDAAADWVATGERGRIVFVVPAASTRPFAGAALSAVAGGFLTTIGQVGAVELGERGITVNTVVRGPLAGEGEDFVEGIPLGRLVKAEEVAAVCAFLVSDAAVSVNGAVVAADGGFTITKSPGGSPLLRS